MNLLLILSGAAGGVILGVVLMLFIIRMMLSKNNAQSESFQKQHAELLELHHDRNRILAENVEVGRGILKCQCRHARATIVEGEGYCDRCGEHLEFNRNIGRWLPPAAQPVPEK